MNPNPIFQILLAVDQLLNTMFFHTKDGVRTWGFADESLSARSWRLKDQGWTWQYKAINKFFFWQDNHCEGAYNSEKLRRQLPAEYRT